MMRTFEQIAQSIIDREFGSGSCWEADGGGVVASSQLRDLLVAAIMAYRDQDLMPTFSLHDRRMRLYRHPDADEGEYVLIAAYGTGNGVLGGLHEVALCMGDSERKELIEELQREPVET